MYANVARVQKWKLDYSHSRSSLRQCSRKMKKEKKKKKRGKKSRSIVPQQTSNWKIRTCQIWSAMNYASLATEFKRRAFWWIPFISSSVSAIAPCCRGLSLYVHFIYACAHAACNNSTAACMCAVGVCTDKIHTLKVIKTQTTTFFFGISDPQEEKKKKKSILWIQMHDE